MPAWSSAFCTFQHGWPLLLANVTGQRWSLIVIVAPLSPVEVQDVDVVALAGPAARHVAAGSAVRAAAAHYRRWAAGRADVKQPAGRELAVGEAVRRAALKRGGEDGRGAT